MRTRPTGTPFLGRPRDLACRTGMRGLYWRKIITLTSKFKCMVRAEKS